jgi:hypothetical protein
MAAGMSLMPGLAYGAPAWGAYPDNAKAALLPVPMQAKNVLEVFLYGGLSPWETFYVVPEYGQPEDPDYPNHQWWTFQEGPDNVAEIYKACHGDAAPPMLQEFRVDSNGMMVQLGPFTEPFRSRKDIIERLRIQIVSHTLEPHEAAIPLAMSGYRLGQPKLAGVGTAIQHYYQARAEIITGEPYAYMLYSPGDFPTDNLRAGSAVGFHPASSRPLSIKVTANTKFIDALKRKQLGDTKEAFDSLLNYYTARYRQRLVWPGQSDAVRALTMTDYDFSTSTLQQTQVLTDILEPEFFKKMGGQSCGQSANNDYPGMGFKLAAHLLTRPGSMARYVCVVDGGLIPASGGGGYDTHNKHIKDSARNLTHMWTHLTSIINEPGENNPGKLNLNETLIVINTEFGRTPVPQNGDGRNHHPYAYCNLMFGGPVGPDQQGIVGAIGPDSLPTGALSPAETRAAILTALGVFPFAPECYAVSDVAGASNELEAALWLKEEVLGIKSQGGGA